MKSVVLYYFSGTGNTEIVANLLGNEFEKQDCHIDVIRIEDVMKGNCNLDIDKYDMVGIGSQVIGFGVPYLVRKFVHLLPVVKNKKVFIFRTAGGVAPINYNASKPMIRVLAKKGYKVFYERIFSISSNWITRFDDIVIRKLYEATNKKAVVMCKEVMSGQERILQTSIILKLLMETAAFISTRFLRIIGKDLKISKACTNCGLCIRNCPSNNIYNKNGKIKFKLSCNSCLRCVYSCPQNAINLKLLFFFQVEDGYNIKKILAGGIAFDETMKTPEPPFFKAYIEDDAL